jgi:hypothetical protein
MGWALLGRQRPPWGAEAAMDAPPLERMGEITVKVWELALAGLPANGGGPLPPDVAWLLAAVARSVPAAAVRCPHVMAALPPGVRAEVLAASAAPVTPLAGQASQEAGSEAQAGRSWLSAAEAGRALGIGVHGARAAARRGRLAATRGPAGEWRIEEAALEQYAAGRRT